MAFGTVKFYNPIKGFGFITPDGGGENVFVHASAVEVAGMQALTEGQRLEFDIETDAKGSKGVRLKACGPQAEDAGAASIVSRRAVDSSLGEVTIYHNPDCGASRNALDAIRNAGYEPRIVEYLKAVPTREELKSLAGRMNLPVREMVRKVEPLFLELRLDERDVGEEEILDAMIEHPILINRPIVATKTAARLCRPSQKVLEFLTSQPAMQ